MDFLTSLKHFFTTSGRLNRQNYFLQMLLLGVVSYLFIVLMDFVPGPWRIYEHLNWFENLSDEQKWCLAGSVFCGLLTIFPASKRLHDIGHPGQIWLIFFVPGVNTLLGLYLIIKEGTKGLNKYSVDPLGRIADSEEEKNKLLAYEETENGNLEKHSWAIAKEQSAGNEEVSRSKYITIRAERLSRASFVNEIENLIALEKSKKGPSGTATDKAMNHRKQLLTLKDCYPLPDDLKNDLNPPPLPNT